MKTKKIFSLTSIAVIAILTGCTKQPYYEVPTDPNGNVVITGVSSTTSAGITTLDDKFTVNATLPNAKAGDVMVAELLKLQTPPTGGAAQLLPLAGTQKNVTVGNDLKTTVTYTRAEAKLASVGDYVTVTFSGKTESGIIKIDLKTATTVVGPQFNSKSVDIMRTSDTAFFDIAVQPKLAAYSGMVNVKRKNGTNASWVNVGTGTFPAGSKVPVSGNDFALGKDTMTYLFVAQQGSYSDTITSTVVAIDPSFFLRKNGPLSLVTPTQGGMNLLTNTSVSATDPNAIILVNGGSLVIKGGTAWSVNGKSISFVPTTSDVYNRNNSAEVINLFKNGAPTSQVDPSQGTGIYIFKLVNGPANSDVIYGMIKVTKLTPATSLDFEYRIGNSYSHLAVIK